MPAEPKNIDIKLEGNILTVKMDLTKDFGQSSSGKTTIVASTCGNVKVKDNIFLGINCYKK